MKPSFTYTLVALAVLLLAYILVIERRGPTSNRSLELASRALPALDAEEVTALEIQRGTNFTVGLVRSNGQWRFVSPFLSLARSEAVDELLTGLEGLRASSILKAGEVARLKEPPGRLGLQAPWAVVSLAREGQATELRLGALTKLGAERYAQLEGRDEAFTVSERVDKLLPETANAWRDASLLRLSSLRFDRLDVRPATNGFEVVRNPANGAWRMTKPLVTSADSSRLEFLFQEIDLSGVEEFVTDDQNVDLERYGLQPPRRELVFAAGNQELAGLQIGSSPAGDAERVYVRRLPSGSLVLAQRRLLEPWLEPFRAFCDRHLMQFDHERVQRIESETVEGGGPGFAVNRADANAWRLVAPFSAPADSLLVLEALAEFAALEFVEFEREVVTDFAPYGLAPPQRSYRLLTTLTNATAAPTGTNQVISQLDVGHTRDIYRLARRPGENSVLRFLDTGRLPRAAFQLRERRLWDFSTNQILRMTIHQLGETRALLRTGPGQWRLAPGSTGTISEFTVEEAAYRLGRLRAERWVAKGESTLGLYGFGSVNHEVVVEVREGEEISEYRVRFGRRASGGRGYASVKLDGQPAPVVFECPAAVYNFVQSDLTLFPSR